MKKKAEIVDPGVSLPMIRARLQGAQAGELFVVANDGHLVGTITLADLSETAFDPDLDHLINADDVARLHPPILIPDDNLDTALKLFRDCGEDLIAVVSDPQSRIFQGSVDERSVMAAYNRALLESRHEERDV